MPKHGMRVHRASWLGRSLESLLDTSSVFFVIAVAYKVPWTAISSLLSELSDPFGPGILLQLNWAYFLPSIPVLLLQSYAQEALERRLGVPQAAALRLCLGLGGLAVLSAAFPSFCTSASGVLTATALTGVLYSLAFGTSYQLVARFPPSCTVSLTTGFVSCGLVVLLLDVSIKRDAAAYDGPGLVTLFRCVSACCVLGLLAAGLLLRTHWARLASGAEVQEPRLGRLGSSSGREVVSISSLAAGRPRRLSSRRNSGSEQAQLYPGGGGHGSAGLALHAGAAGGAYAGLSGGMRQRLEAAAGGDSFVGGGATVLDMEAAERLVGSESWQDGGSASWRSSSDSAGLKDHPGGGRKAAASGVSTLRLALRVSPAALALTLSVGSSMLAFPFFTYVRSDGELGRRLPQLLFYIRLLGDILGRALPARAQLRRLPPLLLWAAVKTALLPLVLTGILRPSLVGGDVALVLLVASFWWLSGYINTGAYLVAPSLVPQACRARAGGLMAATFQLACFGGLLLAAGLQRMWPADAGGSSGATAGAAGVAALLTGGGEQLGAGGAAGVGGVGRPGQWAGMLLGSRAAAAAAAAAASPAILQQS